VDGDVDGGGDGSELTRWGRVGVGDGKRRGVAGAKAVSGRVKHFVVVDSDVTRSEVGANDAEAEAKKGLEGHVALAGFSGQRSGRNELGE